MEYIIMISTGIILCVIGNALFRCVSIDNLEPEVLKLVLPKIAMENKKIDSVIYVKIFMISSILLLSVLLGKTDENRSIFDGIKTLTCITILWPIAWSDYNTYRVPNKILLWGCGIRIFIFLIEWIGQEPSLFYILSQELIGALVVFIATMMCRLVVPQSIGYGDVKLLLLIGVFLGADLLWESMLVTLTISFLVSCVLLIAKKAKRKDVIPFAPFLLIGTILATVVTRM